MAWFRIGNEEGSSAIADNIRLIGLVVTTVALVAMIDLETSGFLFVALVCGGILILFHTLAAVAGRCELLLRRQKQDHQMLQAVALKLGVGKESDKA